MNEFNNWNNIKKEIDNKKFKVFFKERDIFYISLGKNVGYEQDGKRESFSRPVIVFRKFSSDVFLCIPLTTAKKDGIFYFNFCLKNKYNNAILSQIKLVDSKRIIKKIGMISKEDFDNLKRKFSKLLKLTEFFD